jgi:predicted Rossmann-fold nucleotide-binding protein
LKQGNYKLLKKKKSKIRNQRNNSRINARKKTNDGRFIRRINRYFLNKLTKTTALPGGIGTLEEILESMTWRQLNINKHRDGGLKPVILLNINGFYDDLIQMLDKIIEKKFLKKKHWVVINDPSEIMDALNE